MQHKNVMCNTALTVKKSRASLLLLRGGKFPMGKRGKTFISLQMSYISQIAFILGNNVVLIKYSSYSKQHNFKTSTLIVWKVLLVFWILAITQDIEWAEYSFKVDNICERVVFQFILIDFS